MQTNPWKAVAIIAAILVVVIIGFFFFKIGVHNGLIANKNAVDKAWGDVQSAYQRRLDVLPKFADNAKFSVKFQESLAVKVARAREQMGQPVGQIRPNNFAATANNVTAPIIAYMRSEAATEAKTDQITELNNQIENVERVINHQRDAYNAAVLSLNNAIQQWPGSIWAVGWGFTRMESFQAEAGAEKSPDLHMDQ